LRREYVNAIPKEDYDLIEALAPDLTVRELAEKWETTTTNVNNVLRRIGVKAKPAPYDAKPLALRHKALKGQHISPRVAKILELTDKKRSINAIAQELGLTANYVSRIREVFGKADKDEHTAEMIKRIDRILARSEQKDEPAYVSALVLYGWTKGKYNYWRAIKKAANK
jgi:plasmid maintenance system antidote protein VapI